jgi:DNA-binding protein Fis
MVRQGLSGNKDSLYADVMTEVEMALIQESLRQTDGNQTQAARLLGISRPTLKEKIEKFGIKKESNISIL